MTIATAQPQHQPNWVFIAVISGVHIGALFALFPSNFSWAAVGLAILLHWITGGLGITLGWHRLVTHRSFKTPKLLEYFFVFCGTLAMEGGPIQWVGNHRNHHQYSDQELDQHNARKGFWWSHMGWMLFNGGAHVDVEHLTRDINRDPVYRFLDKYFFHIQVVFAGLLYLLGGWPFVVWGVFVRLVLVYHCTWFVNSATHKFGYQTYKSGDLSTNCWWVALVTYGEGWHNNHHAFPYSARHGMQWWEIDTTWMMIQLLQWLRLAKKIRLVESKHLSQKVLAAP